MAGARRVAAHQSRDEAPRAASAALQQRPPLAPGLGRDAADVDLDALGGDRDRDQPRNGPKPSRSSTVRSPAATTDRSSTNSAGPTSVT